MAVLALLREFSPLIRQTLVPLLRGIAIGEPLAFVGAREEFLESVAINYETQLTSWQSKIVMHGLILGIEWRGATFLASYHAKIGCSPV